jgi:response regulator RpfG family c-di-GMP phosphodiesterase
MDENKMISVLYVDDEQPNLSAFKANFRRTFDVYLADSVTKAHQIIAEENIDVVITDHMMPVKSGVDLLEQLKQERPEICRILITGCSDVNIVIEAINRGEVYRFLTKPWVKDVLTNTIESGFEAMQEKKEESELNNKLMETNQQLEFMLRQKLIS